MSGSLIALDVMGGDDAPEATLRGALAACNGKGSLHVPPERLLLVGDQPRMESMLRDLGGGGGGKPTVAQGQGLRADAIEEALRVASDALLAPLRG